MKLTLAGRIWTAYFVALGLSLYACASDAHTEKHGQPVTPAPVSLGSMPPDNWGGWKAHVGVSFAFGGVSTLIVTKERSLKGLEACQVYCQRFALAMLPGLYREWDTYAHKPEPGYRHGLFSKRDLLANAVGAGLGVYAGSVVEGLYFDRQKGNTTVGMTWELK
jgi:hypothetical protein